jgi:NAD(P)H-dependent flavin oxidoreductase YrpB (nitropropane dioxygenase family)
MSIIKTPITDLFGIKHPIILAGMNVAAGPELAAAVTNAGGLGVIGGLGYTPKVLRRQVRTDCDDDRCIWEANAVYRSKKSRMGSRIRTLLSELIS